ncbi:MAG: zinc-dependent alcohol dehydrogenase family protein [Betaproteobacteria bacterium]|nr:zinc-dependent alcohol dehydrogenase family protein [Betaproteobacteria bacterium]
MRAMRLHAAHEKLRCDHLPIPGPGPGQVLVKVHACGVCRTDLHIVDGELTEPKLPLVPGHEIVGTVAALGAGVERHRVGDRVGVPWLGGSCGRCEFCRRGEENLCADARFTGYQLDGGYAEYALADARFCFAIPERYDDASAAPLLCAGLIGYRSLRFAGEARRLGIYGFGAAAHIVAQVAVAERRAVYAFTRAGDAPAQALARKVGACWAGSSQETPPEQLDAAIIFAPVGALVPAALEAVRRGGTVVCGGIHMSDIPSFPYRLLWGERTLRSVANLTRKDAEDFLAVAARVPIATQVETLGLEAANEALDRLRAGKIAGAFVLDARR